MTGRPPTIKGLKVAGSVWLTTAQLLAGCGGSSTTSAGSDSASNRSGGPGTTIHNPVPALLRGLPLTNQHRQRVSLASWPGRTVLLVPFLTLCQDVCPLATGNLLQVEQSLRADHAASNVQIVELTVDPGRDTPARLAAYAKLTHADWQLVTASPAQLDALAKFFGFSYQKVPETSHDARDWWTGKPLTYDVDHSDNYFVINPAGVERVVQDAAPNFHGLLNPKLYTFLDALGRQHLKRPPQPDWTPTDALKALAISVGKPLPLSVS
jgi:cytochrome oxidase Cu insertion factor (SCO1/SenC/PrrC family)